MRVFASGTSRSACACRNSLVIELCVGRAFAALSGVRMGDWWLVRVEMGLSRFSHDKKKKNEAFWEKFSWKPEAAWLGLQRSRRGEA